MTKCILIVTVVAISGCAGSFAEDEEKLLVANIALVFANVLLLGANVAVLIWAIRTARKTSDAAEDTDGAAKKIKCAAANIVKAAEDTDGAAKKLEGVVNDADAAATRVETAAATMNSAASGLGGPFEKAVKEAWWTICVLVTLILLLALTLIQGLRWIWWMRG